MSRLPVLTAVTGAWEAPLVAGLERARGEVHVVRRCADLTELLAAAQAGLAIAAVISGDLYRLDRDAVAELHQVGVAVVGLADPLDPDGVGRLTELGAARVLRADAPAGDVAAAVAEAVRDVVARGATSGGAAADAAPRSLNPARGDPADALADLDWPGFADDGSDSARQSGRHERGCIVAVWGPTGAPGRTTVAVNLAAEFAELGAAALIVDADTYGPSVAQTLGLLDESGGIAGAMRSAAQGGLDGDRLARLAPSLSPTLRVLTGLPRASRWPELRPSLLEVLWRRVRELARWTVVDCGFGLEVDEEISFDTAAPRRNAATLSALAAADVVLAVGRADPVGLARLVHGLAELDEVLAPSVRRQVVITRVRAEAIGPDPDRRIADALARYAGVGEAVLVPDDPTGHDLAMLAGRMLVEVVPGSAARRTLGDLAAALEAMRGAELIASP